MSRGKWLRNIFVVWLLTGFWHGAAWNFILWGLWFGVLLVIEKLWLGRALEQNKLLSHVYVLVAVIFSFILFNASSLTDAFGCIRGMLGLGGLPVLSAEAVYYLKSYAVILIMAVVGATPLPKRLFERLNGSKKGEAVLAVFEPVALAGLLMLCTAYLVDGSFNPFLYFRF